MSWKELPLSECKISYFIDVLHYIEWNYSLNYNRGIQMYRFPNSDVQKSVIFEGIKKRLKIV